MRKVRSYFIGVIIYFLYSHLGFAQSDNIIVANVSFNKSIQIVFDSEIVDVDMGASADEVIVLVGSEKDKLKIKAGIEYFEDTNLIVETTTAFYSFLLKYSEDITKYILLVSRTEASFIKSEESGLEKGAADENKLEKEKGVISNNISSEVKGTSDDGSKEKSEWVVNCKKVLEKRKSAPIDGGFKGKMAFILQGIYVEGNYLYFDYSLENTSNITYDVDFFRFVIKDSKGKMRNASVGEENLYPVFTSEAAVKSIGPGEIFRSVSVFEKFTLSGSENLHMEVWEVGGKRNMELKINNRTVLDAKVFND